MEVKPGYKQTEVGIIPEDWQVRPIHSFAAIKTGPFGTLLKASEYSDGDGVPLISVGEVRAGFFNITDETPRVSSEVTRRLPQYLLKAGDIVFGRKGGVDRSAIVRHDQEGWFLGSDGIAARCTESLSNEYVAYQFQSRKVQSWLIQHAIGTTMPSLNQSILGRVEIPLPPTREEQETIAGALSDADALIESLEQLVAKKRQVKQGMMQELLTGQRRLPGFSGEWETKLLGEIGTFLKGSGVTKSQTLSGDIPCVRYGEIYTRHNNHIRAFYSWISREVAQSATLLKYGDILFAGSGETKEEIGKCVAFIDKIEAYAGGDIVILRPEGLDSLFLGYFLNTTAITRQKASRGQGDAVVHISASALASVQGKFPRLAEQTAIAAVLSDMDAEITAVENRLAKARQVKQGMMQELLTGRIRLV